MEIHQLRSFVYVATELSFRRAAEKLNMTQPPLTRQIQQLEHSLGTALFKRSTRKVELTEAGKVLLNEAGKIIALTEGVASRVQLSARGCSGELVIGIFSWGVIHRLPDYLKTLARAETRCECPAAEYVQRKTAGSTQKQGDRHRLLPLCRRPERAECRRHPGTKNIWWRSMPTTRSVGKRASGWPIWPINP
ncbi:HTH-type transcriptional regulator tdfR [Serratia rubidaea]|uniref:HTH-type transcriptional regulator tdfR n=1 Tax=Serratia rubidaea TaxID=61652 RepID=A0A3S4FLY3_SERRU|nr:HTH-type transcriptional regulator tdfR [Serratia rubidaea]